MLKLKFKNAKNEAKFLKAIRKRYNNNNYYSIVMY